MCKYFLLLAGSLAVAESAAAGWFISPVTPSTLQCEYLQDPLGVDAARPRLSWELRTSGRGRRAPRGVRQTAYQVLVASSEHVLAQGKGDVWDSGKVPGDQPFVAYAGPALTSRRTYHWKVRVWFARQNIRGGGTAEGAAWSAPASWTMGLLESGDWTASWIALDPAAGPAEFPCLRKTFTLDADPVQARVYIASLGYHELYLNGEKVGDDVLSPAVTQLSERSLYLTHDVTRYLRRGENCIAVQLGRGWYFPGHRDFAATQRTGGRPAARVQLEVMAPGGGLRLVTDASWTGSPGPFSRTTRWGLRYDARKEQPGWNKADFDDALWKPAQVCDVLVPNLRAQMVEPNRVLEVVDPVRIEPKGERAWMVDFGKSVVGWCELKLHDAKEAGRTIELKYSDDPRCDQDREEYITSGKGEERFLPQMSYQAFRYVLISGLDHAPAREDLTAHFIRTAYPDGSAFACSNPRLTAIHDMVSYTFQCLTMGGYMVDCPHIERLGYGGDGQASAESAMTMFPLAPLYRNWMAAWRDNQLPDGDLPHTAPVEYAGGGPYWCGFIVAVPWQMYVQYGDRTALEENYPAMQKWLGFVESFCKNGDLKEPWPNTERRNWYLGDWAVPDGVNQQDPASVRLVVNAYRVYVYDLMARIAGALDRPEDAARYAKQAEALRPVLHRALYDEVRKTYAQGGQLDLALPLLTGLVPPDLRPAILRQLEQEIVERRKGHIAVGLVGVPLLVKTLMAEGRDDLLFGMVDKETYPGWGYMIKNGATTTWEHWNAARSRIHNCYNGIGMWFYQALAGIQPDPSAPGYGHFILRPAMVGDLTWVKARQPTVRGTIRSEWTATEDRWTMSIEVPPNATATVYVPVPSEADGDAPAAAPRVTESGRPAEQAPGVAFLRREPGAAVYRVGSGSYVFVSEKIAARSESLSESGLDAGPDGDSVSGRSATVMRQPQ